MWNCPTKPTPEFEVRTKHERDFQFGISNFLETGETNSSLWSALDYLENKGFNGYAVRLIRRGLHDRDVPKLREGYVLILKQLRRRRARLMLLAKNSVVHEDYFGPEHRYVFE